MAGSGDLFLTGTVMVPQVVQHLGLTQGEPGVPQACQQFFVKDSLVGHEKIVKGRLQGKISSSNIRIIIVRILILKYRMQICRLSRGK